MKNLKKIISVMLAVLIVFFCSASSIVTASAEEVTPSNTYDTAYFQNLFEKAEMDTTQFTLSGLTPDNYTVIVSQSLYDEVINIHFIPKSKDPQRSQAEELSYLKGIKNLVFCASRINCERRFKTKPSSFCENCCGLSAF